MIADLLGTGGAKDNLVRLCADWKSVVEEEILLM